MYDSVDGLPPAYWERIAKEHDRRDDPRLGYALGDLYDFLAEPLDVDERARRATITVVTSNGRTHEYGVNHYPRGIMLEQAPQVGLDLVTFTGSGLTNGYPGASGVDIVERILIKSITSVRVDLISMFGDQDGRL